ncbi:hypothetical protein ABC382_00815 [Lysinibacillus sp. 1P01SD]|uniref:hypothetical protein n=1 Tax=Lysinibacillus sp. 1P01SD TaxID=3132285 RepID=UPI00399F1369
MSNTTVLSTEKTNAILDKFFSSCKAFWEREKQNNSHYYKEEIDVTQNALHDISKLKNNPFSPNGNPLNMEAKSAWLITNGYIKK